MKKRRRMNNESSIANTAQRTRQVKGKAPPRAQWEQHLRRQIARHCRQELPRLPAKRVQLLRVQLLKTLQCGAAAVRAIVAAVRAIGAASDRPAAAADPTLEVTISWHSDIKTGRRGRN